MVYVLDIEGKPLMPTERHGKVRKLLRDGKAHVVKLMPFTIQLNYQSTLYKQEISLGVDAGSVHIGMSSTTEKKELFAAEILLRTDIVKRISSRLILRRDRRYRKTRYRVARFDNRLRNKSWIAPSIRNKIDCHLKLIKLVYDILPISKTTIEIAQFDAQKIKNDQIQGVDYQCGEQAGFWNVREYVLFRDGHKCQHCKGKSGDKVLNVHHLESRRTGGDAPNNLITLCETCHKSYHRGEFELNVKRGISLRNAAAMNIMRETIYSRAKEEFKNVMFCYGYQTKHIRIKNKINKTHCSDAYCISGNIQSIKISPIKVRCVRRHTRSLHVLVPKKGGKRRSAIAGHWVGKYRLQKYDFVQWNNIKCFIFGSSHGRAVLKNIDGEEIVKPRHDITQSLRLLARKRNGYIVA